MIVAYAVSTSFVAALFFYLWQRERRRRRAAEKSVADEQAFSADEQMNSDSLRIEVDRSWAHAVVLEECLFEEQLNADFMRIRIDILEAENRIVESSLQTVTKNRNEWVSYTRKLEPLFFSAAFASGRDGARSTVLRQEIEVLRPQIDALAALLVSCEDEKRWRELVHEVIRLVSKLSLRGPAGLAST
jgi:hypothetical protein